MRTVSNQSSDRNPNSAPQGGQASIGLFGLPGFHGPRQPLPRTPRASRIKGALNSFSSDGLSAAHYQKPATAPQPVTTVHVRRGSFQAFVRLAERETRPVEAVLLEWLADCANLICQSDFAQAYGDPAPVCTPAMEAAARESDRRESRCREEDDAADFWQRASGHEGVHVALAIED